MWIKAVKKRWRIAVSSGPRGEITPMIRRVLVMFSSIILLGAIGAVCPLINQLVSTAQAQTATDYPNSFTGSLVERSSDRVAIKRTVYVGAYSSVRLGG